MKNEKVIVLLENVLDELKKQNTDNYRLLENVEKTLEDFNKEILSKSIQKASNKEILRIIKDIQKNIPEGLKHKLEDGIFENDDIQFILNDCNILIIKNKIKELKYLKTKEQESMRKLLESQYLNFYKKLKEDYTNKENIKTNYKVEKIITPTINELKLEVKKYKENYEIETGKQFPRKNIICYVFENGLTLNANFLINTIKATNSNELYTIVGKDGKFRNICVVYGEDYDVIIMPINNNHGYKGNSIVSI